MRQASRFCSCCKPIESRSRVWPIVMNTQAQLPQAVAELRNGPSSSRERPPAANSPPRLLFRACEAPTDLSDGGPRIWRGAGLPFATSSFGKGLEARGATRQGV